MSPLRRTRVDQGTPQSKEAVSRPRKRTRGKSQRAPSDLFLTLPTLDTTSGRPILVRQLTERLKSAGYESVAFTHTVYGKPKETDDDADVALPESSLLSSNGQSICAPGLSVFRRLHAVIENLSDVGFFISQEDSPMLKKYDLVSIAPRNEAVFRSAISSAAACDIITLDYTVGRSGLPYRIRPADMKVVVERQIILEMPYAPAILQSHLRRSMISTAADLQQASRGRSPTLLLSSGERRGGAGEPQEQKDVGALALRMPADLQNLVDTVLRLDPKMADAVLTTAPQLAIARGRQRRFGNNVVESVSFGDETDEEPGGDVVEDTSGKNVEETSDDKLASDGDDGVEDGFISF